MAPCFNVGKPLRSLVRIPCGRPEEIEDGKNVCISISQIENFLLGQNMRNIPVIHPNFDLIGEFPNGRGGYHFQELARFETNPINMPQTNQRRTSKRLLSKKMEENANKKMKKNDSINKDHILVKKKGDSSSGGSKLPLTRNQLSATKRKNEKRKSRD